MKYLIFSLIACLMPISAFAQDRAGLVEDIVKQDILPGFALLEAQAESLSTAAQGTCDVEALEEHFFQAFAAWTRVSHLRFGPSEVENRAFALAFWPDPRGKTQKALRQLLLKEGVLDLDPEEFREETIAGRGFYALEYLLYDTDIAAIGTSSAHCALIRAITRDIHTTAAELNSEWQGYAPLLTHPLPEQSYRSIEEVVQVLYKSAVTGLQFTADMRLGRPLGTFERPRPRRAEAWRSGLSLALTRLAADGSGTLALRLAAQDKRLSERLNDAISRFLTDAETLDDPVFAGVATPQGRIRVEALLTSLNEVRRIVEEDLGAHLGVISGFNALDGD